MGEEQCNFARWLHGDGPERVKASPQLARIQALHTQVHAIAPELLRLHRRGDAQATRTMLTEMHRLRDELLAQLKGLLRRQ
jgi:hypothetical protein